MEFRKMVTITLYMRQQKRHWCIEQSFGLCGRGRGWDDLGEWHWNMYNIIYETSRQSRFDARYWMLGAGALGRPRGMVRGGRREEGSGWGTCVYLWRIHVDIWQNEYNIVKLKNKIKKKKKVIWSSGWDFLQGQFTFASVRQRNWPSEIPLTEVQGSSPSPRKRSAKKTKRLSEEALQIAVKRREAKSKGEKERYKHLNAEFQRIARRDKKAFLSDQCKE